MWCKMSEDIVKVINARKIINVSFTYFSLRDKENTFPVKCRNVVDLLLSPFSDVRETSNINIFLSEIIFTAKNYLFRGFFFTFVPPMLANQFIGPFFAEYCSIYIFTLP
jgi:hypothetical protein